MVLELGTSFTITQADLTQTMTGDPRWHARSSGPARSRVVHRHPVESCVDAVGRAALEIVLSKSMAKNSELVAGFIDMFIFPIVLNNGPVSR